MDGSVGREQVEGIGNEVSLVGERG
jgi:hypothetical protein